MSNTMEQGAKKCQLSVLFVFYFLVFSFLLSNSFGYLDPDLGWHLRVGERIASEWAVPTYDTYNTPLEGKTWVDHEWLANFFVYWLYDSLGYPALNVFFALLVVLTLALLNAYARKNFWPSAFAGSTFYAMVFGVIGVFGMAPHLGVRLQEFALLGVLSLLIILHGYAKKKKSKTLIWLIPLMLLWANMHGSFLIGIFLIFFFAAVKSLELVLSRTRYARLFRAEEMISPKQLAIFCLFGLSAVAATLINPYGIELYGFLGEYGNTFYMNHIGEWLPIYILPLQYGQLLYGALAASTMILTLSFVFSGPGKERGDPDKTFDLWRLAITLLFLLLAFKSKRHFPLFFITSFFWMMEFSGRQAVLPAMTAFTRRLVGVFVFSAFLLASAGLILKTDFVSDPFRDPGFCARQPCGAVDFLKADPRLAGLKIFNAYNWGGYLLWVWPEKKIWIDGRLPQYRVGNQTFLQEYLDFFDEGRAGEKLDEYGIDLAMLGKKREIKLNWVEKHIFGADEEKMNDQKNHLKEYLNDADNWSLVYNDKVADIYVRTK